MAIYVQDRNRLINQAIQFATAAHGDQVRKGNKYIPYIFHPIDVANEVIYFSGLPEEELEKASILAILHDVVEDTDVTEGDIRNEFGSDIANDLMCLTKNSSLPKCEQFAENLDRLCDAPVRVQCVKLADRGSNLKTFPAMWGRDKISEYLDEAVLIADKLGSSSETLKARLLMSVSENRFRLSICSK